MVLVSLEINDFSFKMVLMKWYIFRTSYYTLFLRYFCVIIIIIG